MHSDERGADLLAGVSRVGARDLWPATEAEMNPSLRAVCLFAEQQVQRVKLRPVHLPSVIEAQPVSTSPVRKCGGSTVPGRQRRLERHRLARAERFWN
jgi:hypothetical protein